MWGRKRVSKSKAAVLLINPDDFLYGDAHMMAQCLLLCDEYLHFSYENLHFISHMPRLTSVRVNIFSILRLGDIHKRHACAIHWDASGRGRRRANIPTS